MRGSFNNYLTSVWERLKPALDRYSFHKSLNMFARFAAIDSPKLSLSQPQVNPDRLETLHLPLPPHPSSPYFIATCRIKLACSIGVLLAESLARVNNGLERIPATDVTTSVTTIAT